MEIQLIVRYYEYCNQLYIDGKIDKFNAYKNMSGGNERITYYAVLKLQTFHY
jgi:hypothetical protein